MSRGFWGRGGFFVFDRRLGVPGSPKRKRLGIVFWMDE